MIYLKQAACVLLAVSLLAASGCGGASSPADKAMQDLYDIGLEAKNRGEDGDPAAAMALFGRMMEAATKLEEEMKKLSPEEQEAFKARWEKKFKDAGLESP
jgi:hypothetical protein